jgi:hypothetical protein
MIGILRSTASEASQWFQEAVRRRGENNLTWLRRHLPADDTLSSLVLLGGTSPTAFRLRVAQSHVRHDMVPSHWSQVMILGRPNEDFSTTPVYEISLEPIRGFGFPPPTNGVQQGQLRQYRNPRLYPNIAVLGIAVPFEDMITALQRFQGQRPILDAPELILRWLAFVWGAAGAGNPLYESMGIPSAAMVEVVFAELGFDLTPGLESRASCPEAIWQAAKWWHAYYARDNRQAPRGAYHIGQRL